MSAIHSRTRIKKAAAGASWLALLAASTLGIGAVDWLRARVKVDVRASDEVARQCRLVVQTYAVAATTPGSLPPAQAKPLGSVQRAVTFEELQRGVAVDIVQLDDEAESAKRGVVLLAWVEPGAPDLEFDARRARPGPGALYGTLEWTARKDVDLVLRQVVAA